MTERSLFWTAGGGGAEGAYTQDELRLPWKAFAGARGPDDGVFRGHLNGYYASLAGTKIRIASGRGLCDGTVHENDADFDIEPVSTTGVTGGVVVLEKKWSTREVRLRLHQNSDGNAAIPALTQIDGTTWEIPLWNYTVNGSAITIKADRRRYLKPLDEETVLRAFYEGGAYAFSQLGGAPPTTLATAQRVGVGWETYITGTASITYSSVMRGGWQLQVSADNSRAVLRGPQLVRINQDWVGIFVLASSNDTYYVSAGLHETNTDIKDNKNEVGFRSVGSVDGGKFYAYADNGNAETSIDTGVAADGNKHVFVVSISGGGTVADFWVDGAAKARITTNLPSTGMDLYGQVGISGNVAGAHNLHVGDAMFFARAAS